MEDRRTIRVTGKGQIKVKPDRTRITLKLEGISPEYAETLRRSSEDTEQIRRVLLPFGFERSDLKTLRFSVDTEYENYKEKSAWKQRLVGYKFRHMLKVEFDSDNERLGKLLYALANCALRPELQISYTVKDQEAAKNELLGKAVTDAKAKAAVLASAAGVELKAIQSIDYSWDKLELESTPMTGAIALGYSGATAQGSSSYDLNIEPDDIEVSDTVTVIWEIG